MIMSANTGVSLALITRPAQYPDPGLSRLVRDAIHQAILLDPAADTTDTTASDARTAAATTLLSSLDDLTPEPFTPAESALLGQWLTQIPNSPKGPHHD
jgi:hypothetical protein